MKNFLRQLYEGLFTNNPVLVQLIGMCPTLATTTSLENGFGMGMAATAVDALCDEALWQAIRAWVKRDGRQ